MKALLYKEFKLAMHPVCYVFIFLFPFMVLIPNYPLCIGFIYVLAAYPVLFLGANKGQQSNDLLYSVLQPVRKKDVVLARMITVIFMQVVTILMMSALYPLSSLINNAIFQEASQKGQQIPVIPGMSLTGFVSVMAFGVLCFAIADLVFFPIYYHKGRSIVASTLITIFSFCFLILLTTLFLPLFLPGYRKLFCESGVGIQFLFLGIAIVLSIVIHFFVYKTSSKELEKVDL